MLKRLAAAAALSLIPTIAVVAPADAARSCNVTVPSKVAITSPYKAITARYSSGCVNYADFAAWDVMHPTQGWEDGLDYDSEDGRNRQVMDWYDWSPLGTYTVRPYDAWDFNYNYMSQNSPKMTVKVGSRLSVSSSRSGRYVTVKGTASRYKPWNEAYRPWASTTVTLRQKACSTCSWKTLKTAKTNRYGKVSFRTYATTTRYWQIRTKDISTTWGRTSATVRR